MTATAAEVPGRYDVVINGEGYVLANTEPQRASYAYSPTFVPRSNVQGDYGDNQQDFWLTFSQNDWSGGDQQRFFRTDDTHRNRFWTATSIDLSITGQVSIQDNTPSLANSSTRIAGCGTGYDHNKLYVIDSTKLYSVTGDGTIADLGAHGAGTPYPRAVVSDGVYVYIGGSTATRKYNISVPAFSNFTTSVTSSLSFLNNTLYAMDSTFNTFEKFDTAGTATTLLQWKAAEGTTHGVVSNLHAYGPNMAVLRATGEEYLGSELWLYNGTSTAKTVEFPSNFIGDGMADVNGVLYVAGAFITKNRTKYQSAVYFYTSTDFGLLWKSAAAGSSTTIPSICSFQNGLVFTDETTGNFMFYNPATGAINSIGTFTTGNVTWSFNDAAMLFAAGSHLMHTRDSTTTYFYPSTTTKVTSATLTTSLADFDSSLDKYVKAVKVDFDAATDGNGGSVDISYQLNSVDGAFTSLQTSAVAGTEYTVGQSCRSITIKVTLNKGTSTNGPVLKRIYVRAAPILQQFKRREYIIDCTGRDGKTPLMLRDGQTPHPKDGLTMAQDLVTAIASTTPISFTDRFGTFTGIIEPDGTEFTEIRPEEFIAKVRVRQV